MSVDTNVVKLQERVKALEADLLRAAETIEHQADVTLKLTKRLLALEADLETLQNNVLAITQLLDRTVVVLERVVTKVNVNENRANAEAYFNGR